MGPSRVPRGPRGILWVRPCTNTPIQETEAWDPCCTDVYGCTSGVALLFPPARGRYRHPRPTLRAEIDLREMRDPHNPGHEVEHTEGKGSNDANVHDGPHLRALGREQHRGICCQSSPSHYELDVLLLALSNGAMIVLQLDDYAPVPYGLMSNATEERPPNPCASWRSHRPRRYERLHRRLWSIQVGSSSDEARTPF